LREEETRHPEGGRLTIYKPLLHEGDSVNEVLKPGCERLQRGIGYFLPILRYSSILEAAIHRVKLLTHYDETLNSFLK
jgi:hypothetical protein